MSGTENPRPPLIAVTDLEMRFGERVLQRNISFEIAAGQIFVIMGRSGCGKSTLLRHMTGLMWDPLESTCRHASLSIL